MIFIIIPVFNRKEFTRNCLLSLRGQTFREFETVVIDDNSTDGTFGMLHTEFPEVHVIQGDGNLWWAGATNAGIEYVLKTGKAKETDFILTLNNDLEVPVNYLENLIHFASTNERSILGSVSVDITKPDQVDFCGVAWNEFTGWYHSKAKDYHHSYPALTDQKQMISSDMLPGRGTLFSIKVINEIGLFDAINFPQYAADEDFSLRARRKGWNLIIPPEVYVKSHIAETGADIKNVKFNFKYYKYIFFSIKSPLNLKIRYRWAMKNTPLKFFYFLIDCSKIMLSVFFKTVRSLMYRLKFS